MTVVWLYRVCRTVTVSRPPRPGRSIVAGDRTGTASDGRRQLRTRPAAAAEERRPGVERRREARREGPHHNRFTDKGRLAQGHGPGASPQGAKGAPRPNPWPPPSGPLSPTASRARRTVLANDDAACATALFAHCFHRDAKVPPSAVHTSPCAIVETRDAAATVSQQGWQAWTVRPRQFCPASATDIE